MARTGNDGTRNSSPGKPLSNQAQFREAVSPEFTSVPEDTRTAKKKEYENPITAFKAAAEGPDNFSEAVMDIFSEIGTLISFIFGAIYDAFDPADKYRTDLKLAAMQAQQADSKIRNAGKTFLDIVKPDFDYGAGAPPDAAPEETRTRLNTARRRVTEIARNPDHPDRARPPMDLANEIFGDTLGTLGYDEEQRKSILELMAYVADVESSDDYNIAYGNRKANFTSMSINKVLQWQEQNNPPGNATAAAGRYQITNKTLKMLKTRLNLTGNEVFDKAMQDRMALELLKIRGLDSYIAGTKTAAEFMNELSKEWAALENSRGVGHYDKDGINQSREGSGQKVAQILSDINSPTRA